jgi:hypothetical protein
MSENQKHNPTEEQRRLVKQLSGVGVPQDDICHIIDITKPTLHKYYRRELDLGMAEANAKVAGSLFNQAVSGNTAAAIFWSKARMGWRETSNVELSGDVVIRATIGGTSAKDDG